MCNAVLRSRGPLSCCPSVIGAGTVLGEWGDLRSFIGTEKIPKGPEDSLSPLVPDNDYDKPHGSLTMRLLLIK